MGLLIKRYSLTSIAYRHSITAFIIYLTIFAEKRTRNKNEVADGKSLEKNLSNVPLLLTTFTTFSSYCYTLYGLPLSFLPGRYISLITNSFLNVLRIVEIISLSHLIFIISLGFFLFPEGPKSKTEHISPCFRFTKTICYIF